MAEPDFDVPCRNCVGLTFPDDGLIACWTCARVIPDRTPMQRLRNALRALSDNIDEFGTITDGELLIELDEAIDGLDEGEA